MANFAEIFKPLRTRMLRGALMGGITGGVGGFLTGHGPQAYRNALGMPQYSEDTHVGNAIKGALIGSALGAGAGAATHHLFTNKMTQLRRLGRSMGRVQQEIDRLEQARAFAPQKMEGMGFFDRLIPNNRRIIREVEGGPGAMAEAARNEKKLRRLQRLREQQLEAKNNTRSVAMLAKLF